MLAALAILGGTAWVGLLDLNGRLASERQALGQAVASHLDYVVQSDLGILQGVSGARGVDSSGFDLLPEQAAVRDAYLRAHLLKRVFLLGRDGSVLEQEPQPSLGAPRTLPPEAETSRAFTSGRPVVSNLVVGDASTRLFLLVPLRNWRGQVVALACGEIDPSASRFAALLDSFRLGDTGSAELIDENGIVIGSTDPARRFRRSDDWTRLARESRGRGPVVEKTDGTRAVLAVAPLATAPWSVVIRQDEAEAFAQVRTLETRLAWLGPTLLAFALVFAWGAARSVRRPLVVLTASAEQIAGGDLDRPIPRLADDEVGRLGRALEEMRVALRRSLEEIAQVNQELEARVEARTQELQGLYQQLQAREEWREELLRKVISAQEDERRRIARELHDETSQTLSALAMKLETALAAWPGGCPASVWPRRSS